MNFHIRQPGIMSAPFVFLGAKLQAPVVALLRQWLRGTPVR